MRVRVLVAALAVQLVLAGVLVFFAVHGFPFVDRLPGAGSGSTAATARPAASTPRDARFDAARAWRDLRYQVALGPRPAGSPRARRLAAWLRARLPGGHYERVGGGLENVVGSLPGRGPPVVVGAHYDTKDLPGFVGADDGAAGVAVLVELARALRAQRPPGGPALRFVAFAGEESPRGTPEADFARTGLRGSRADAAAHARATRAVVLLDFVGNRDVTFPREAGSDPALWARLRAAAARAGVGGAFPARTVGEVIDDHTPYAESGVPAVDLIDFDYPCLHRRCDDLAHVAQRSLGIAGTAVLALLRGW